MAPRNGTKIPTFRVIHFQVSPTARDRSSYFPARRLEPLRNKILRENVKTSSFPSFLAYLSAQHSRADLSTSARVHVWYPRREHNSSRQFVTSSFTVSVVVAKLGCWPGPLYHVRGSEKYPLPRREHQHGASVLN